MNVSGSTTTPISGSTFNISCAPGQNQFYLKISMPYNNSVYRTGFSGFYVTDNYYDSIYNNVIHDNCDASHYSRNGLGLFDDGSIVCITEPDNGLTPASTTFFRHFDNTGASVSGGIADDYPLGVADTTRIYFSASNLIFMALDTIFYSIHSSGSVVGSITIDPSIATLQDSDRIHLLPDGRVARYISSYETETGTILFYNNDLSISSSVTADPIWQGGSTPIAAYDMSIQDSGKYIVSSVGDHVSGNAVSGIFRLNTDGTYDSSFSGSGVGGGSYKIKVLSDDSILYANIINDLNDGDPIIRKLNADGTTDETFNVLHVGLNSNFNVEIKKVTDFVVLPSGKILVSFINKYEPYMTFYCFLPSLIQLNSDGSFDRVIATTSVIPEENYFIINNDKTSGIENLLFDPSNYTLYVSGRFNQLNGNYLRGIGRIIIPF
jgi:hypothetical protein